MLEAIDAMFVQTATRFESDQGRVSLHGVAAATLYFADRPSRSVGHVATALFVELWPHGENSFADDPPNAVFSFIEPGETMPEGVVVVLRDPHLDGDTLQYSVDVLEGSVPTSAGPCTVFIDPYGQRPDPVTPMDVVRSIASAKPGSGGPPSQPPRDAP